MTGEDNDIRINSRDFGRLEGKVDGIARELDGVRREVHGLDGRLHAIELSDAVIEGRRINGESFYKNNIARAGLQVEQREEKEQTYQTKIMVVSVVVAVAGVASAIFFALH